MAKVSEAKLTDFVPDPDNANVGTERGQAMIEDSIREDGAARSIVVDADNIIVAGSKTHQSAVDAGLDKAVVVEVQGDELVVVRRTDFSLGGDDGRARRYAYRDNRSGEINLTWSAEQMLADLNADVDLSAMFTDLEMEAILGDAWLADEPGEAPAAQMDKGAELAEKYGVEVGQIWQLGEHRLAVGDCTDRAVVKAVLEDEVIDLVVVDPPYSVNYGAKNRALQTIGRSNRLEVDIAGDTLSTGETADIIWGPAFENAYNNSRNGTVIYCFAPQGGDQMMMMMMMMKAKWNERLHQLIWRKNAPTFSMGRLDYQYQHEPILYSWRGTNHGFYADTGRSVIDCDRPSSSKLHPTMKPVELIELFINNSSRSGEIVYDGFIGSGTTLIACERLGRKCRAMEIEPKYCAITIQRWVDLTGKGPKLLRGSGGGC
jgi:DNA modification methylase